MGAHGVTKHAGMGWSRNTKREQGRIVRRIVRCRAAANALSPALGRHRGDVVRLETWFAEESRLTTRRDWVISDAATGARLGAATRCAQARRTSPSATAAAACVHAPLPAHARRLLHPSTRGVQHARRVAQPADTPLPSRPAKSTREINRPLPLSAHPSIPPAAHGSSLTRRRAS